MMTKEQFLREAIINLENKLFEAREELAELKASIPQIKHDAIMAATVVTDYFATADLTSYAKNALAQAKERSECTQ